MHDVNLNRDFADLREFLHEDTVPPDFATIRGARVRRIRRRAAIGGSALAVVVALSVTLVVGLARAGSPPQPDPTVGSDETGPRRVADLAAAPSGALFALVAHCESDCDTATPMSSLTVDRSDDQGGSWRVVSRFSEPPWKGEAAPRLIVATDLVMWRVSYTGEVMGTTDGGLNWLTWQLTLPTQTLVLASLTEDGRLWLDLGGRVYTATGGGEPTPVLAAPAPGRVDQLVGVDDTSAFARVDKDKLTWYRTVDGGEHWNKITPPCESVPGTEFASLAHAHDDGSLWSFCMKINAKTGIMAKTLMLSTDDGKSWVKRVALDNEEGYAFLITPFSTAVAWRSDIDHVFRTEDVGVQWAAVVPHAKGPSGKGMFLATGPRTAIWAEDSGKLWLTTDGGASWTAQDYPR